MFVLGYIFHIEYSYLNRENPRIIPEVCPPDCIYNRCCIYLTVKIKNICGLQATSIIKSLTYGPFATSIIATQHPGVALAAGVNWLWS